MSKSTTLYKVDTNTKEESFFAAIGDSICIGKSENAEIRLADWRCNGIHAVFKRNGESFEVVDLGSYFGTFVNKMKVENKILKEGDLLKIGDHNFVVRVKNSVPDKAVIPENIVEAPKKPKMPGEDHPSEYSILEVALYWGAQLIEVKSFYEGEEITIGNPKKSTFGMVLEEFKDESDTFKLGDYKKHALHLKIPQESVGLIWQDNKTFALDTLRYYDKGHRGKDYLEVFLNRGDQAHIEFGELSLFFKFTKPPEKIPWSLNFKLDKTLAKIFGGIILFYLLAIGIMALFTIEEKEKELEDIPEHIKKTVYDIGIQQATEKRKAAIGQLAQNLQGGRARAEEGASKARKTKEKMNEKKPTAKTEPVKEKAVKSEAKVTSNIKKSSETAKEKPIDLDASFDVSSNTEIVNKASILSNTEESGNTASAINESGFARGKSGLGAGGGGSSVGVGALEGNMTGGGMGAGDYGLTPSKGKQIQIQEQEEVVMQDGLDPDLILAIIKRYLPQIQHCYELGLTKNSKLRGKVKVSFVISANGTVTVPKIVENSLNHATTESCILGKVKKWKFPQPKGGGTVAVAYPFIFESNSGD